MSFVAENGLLLLRFTVLHVGIVALSVALAFAVAFPLGIWVTRPNRQLFAAPLLNLANIFQTVPSLAVIGLSSALFSYFNRGVGWAPAIVALFLYSLLPIFSNTIAGLQSVPRAALKAALGMGMSSRQILWQVELPLASAIILAGVRTATVINVGTAALAAAIGADCLGTLIFQGISAGNIAILLAGAVPTALLALVLEGAFSILQKRITPATGNG